jgi:flagellar hook assembly protein FlgD
MDYKEFIQKNKKALSIVGGTLLGGLVLVAVVFSSGTLFKGDFGPIIIPQVITCSANPATAKVGEKVTWTATVSGVADPQNYTYKWSGDVGGSSPQVDVTYTSTGTKTAGVELIMGPNNAIKAVPCIAKIESDVVVIDTINTIGESTSLATEFSNPVISGDGFSSNIYDSNSNTDLKFTYKIYNLPTNVQATVQAWVYDKATNTAISKFPSELKTNGTYTLTWNGQVAGQKVPDGNYAFKITGTYPLGNIPPIFQSQLDPKEASFSVKAAESTPSTPTPPPTWSPAPTPPPTTPPPTTPPPTLPPSSNSAAISNLAVDSNIYDLTTDQNGLKLSYTLQNIQNKNIVTEIYNTTNQKITLSNDTKSSGNYEVTWNGNWQNNAKATTGEYILKVSLRENNAEVLSKALTFNVKNDQTSTPTPPATPTDPSKCQNVSYPTDIENHWAKDYIKAAYDLCLLSGYVDKTFRPNQSVTRAEATKMVLAAANIKPAEGCKDTHCGANYQVKVWTDITALWQGQWIRAARDLGIVEGYPDNTFRPNNLVTRAEAAALISKTKPYNIPPHQGCYTANCGAGHPNNFFTDIKDFWQGPYIRAAWDAGLVKGTAPNTFEPNRPITRGEMAKMIMEARK